MRTVSIIIKPIITEKSLRDVQKGIFTFAVFKNATKSQVSAAVEKIFNVHVASITTVKIKGKRVVAGRRRMEVFRPDTKKARVKLLKGEKIDLFETGEK